MGKHIMIIWSLMLTLIGYPKIIFAQEQKKPIQLDISLKHAQVSNQGKKYNALGFLVTLKNTTGEDIFLPYKQLDYHKQRNDSLIIKKSIDGKYDYLVKIETGVQTNQVIGSNLHNPLLVDYYTKHQEYKTQAQKILIENEKNGKLINKSFNPLFVKAGETIILYFIPDNLLFRQEGNFEAMFKFYSSKNLTDIPESILGYKRVDIGDPLTTAVNYTISKATGESLKLTIQGKKVVKVIFVPSSLINETF